MSKGSNRRPGVIPPAAWERIFGKPAPANLPRSAGMRCPVCCAKAGEQHLPSCPEHEHPKENN